MVYQSTEERACYFPPILGNGEISLSPDCEGGTAYEKKDFPAIDVAPSGCIFRAGRRLPILPNRTPAKILSFGTLGFDRGVKPDVWQQELISEKGIVESQCHYPDGATVASTAFIHPHCNLYALEKRFSGPMGTARFTYTLGGYDADSDRAFSSVRIRKIKNGAKLSFVLQGQDVYTGEVLLWTEQPAQVDVHGRTVILTCQDDAQDRFTLYLCLEDDLYGQAPEKINHGVRLDAARKGFSGLRLETEKEWAAYFAQGFVETGDREADAIYHTCLYHLKCWTTRWSIPVGLNDCSWDGKFFAFDEYYSYLGLLGANRTELARHVPAFRLEVCLEKAIQRASKLGEDEARYRWETNEYGDEVGLPGFWYEHIFHIALIALGAFEYYEHTQDRPFLEKCYPMIRACAQFYTRHMLYQDANGRIYLGKCTDLERLGSSVENPFFSACGVIKTLETLSKAAEILDVDPAYRAECREKAAKLRESLPHEEGRYVPYAGCTQKSIAVFAGKFPFDVLANDDPLQAAAWEDFIANEGEYGNMYKVGRQVSPWYACWKAEGFARIGHGEEAYASLCQAYASTGVFHEMFEINEPGKIYRPWFTTAAGIFLSSVNEMLLQGDGNTLNLLPAWPCLPERLAFRLSAKGGAIVDFAIEAGKVKKLDIVMRPGLAPKEFSVTLQGKPYGQVISKMAD